MMGSSRACAALILALSLSRPVAAQAPPLAQAPFDAEQARRHQQQWSEHIGHEQVITNSLGMPMMLLPPGEFTMGRTEEEFDLLLETIESDAKLRDMRGGMVTWSMLMMPAHPVRLTKPFYMGATEVTVGQFRQFVEASGYVTEAEQGLNQGQPYQGGRAMSTWRKPMAWRRDYKQADDEPVLHLCWNDCVAFCKWLSETEGVEYHLPTEAQWEYACRAGTTTPWSFGGFDEFDAVSGDYAWWSDGGQGSHDRPRAVAQGKPNAFGLYDMHGNVWEYVHDWWHRLSYKESPLNDPTGPAQQSEKNDMRRIIRGSSFDWGRWGGDSAYRMRITQRSNQHPHMGFRVAMKIDGVEGVPPAVDPQQAARNEMRDPGADSKAVAEALARGADKGEPPAEISIDLDGDVTMDFVLIPAGSFLMGSAQGDRDELPRHRVVISRPFYMAKYELTQSQWEALMGPDQRLAGLRTPDNEMHGPMKAMNALSWDACQTVVGKLREVVPQHSFALPTEAQWEYACRAGSTTEFHFGDDEANLGDYAWHAGNMIWPGQPAFAGKAHYHDVGLRKPNAWGLYDMHGGVWEWCADWYDPDYYLASPLADPGGPGDGRFRVLRGGSWFRYGKYARSGYRRFFHPESDSDGVTAWILDFGCRVVINLDDAQSASTSDADAGVDYTKLARSLVRHPRNPVVTVGTEGAWDDQTLGCLSVLHDSEQFWLYTGGARLGQPKQIGMATSPDGVHWTKYEQNPLFPGSMPYTVKVGESFHMYHPGRDPNGRYGLLLRTSHDGFHWSDPELVLAGNILDPCVVPIDEGTYHLYFCAGGQKEKDGRKVWEFQNFVATSQDGKAWTKQPGPVLPLGPEGSWDEYSHAGPCVLKLPDGFHMWYLGSGDHGGKTAWRIGHAASPDGLAWTKSGTDPVLDIGPPGAWDGGTFLSFDAVFHDGRLLFWYAAAPTEHGDETRMTIQIGHGASREPTSAAAAVN